MLSNHSNKEIFSNLDDSVISWLYVSAEVEALRRASLVKTPCCNFSHSAPAFCFSTSTIQQSEDSLCFHLTSKKCTSRNHRLHCILHFLRALQSIWFWAFCAASRMSLDCTEVSVIAQILFSSLCPAWWMLLLYKLQLPWKHSTLGELSILKIALLTICTECN